MSHLRHFLAAASLAAFFLPAGAVDTAEQQFVRLTDAVARKSDAPVGQLVEVEIDPASLAPAGDAPSAGSALFHYPMAFNNIAEGWSWQPGSDPATQDYYRYKYLPLQSVLVDKGGYQGEDKIGTPQAMQVVWRYDYFLAFDNPYDFYPKTTDDGGGFEAVLPAEAAGRVAMRAVARLEPPVVSESTTFWKAIYSRPTDFTLKKRYLVGHLEEIRLVDRENGNLLARLLPHR